MMLAPALLLALTAAPPTCAPTQAQRDDTTWLRNNCALLTSAQDERVAQAEHILSDLVKMKRLGRTFTLLVLDRLRGPQAYITPKRAILLSRDALELCYANSSRDDGAANLGFVLAHELAHWAHADRLTEREGGASDALFEFAVRDWEAREFKADATAVVDVVRAGFDPTVILRGDLMRRWAHADGGPRWYEQRTRALRDQAKEVKKALPLFDAGAAYLLAGDYELAAAMLETFEDETAYGGREVLTDIGFANLQLAFVALDACNAHEARRFVLPGVIDTHARLSHVRGTSPAVSCREDVSFQTAIRDAQDYLDRVVGADPDYIPAILNLVAARLLAGEYMKARAAGNADAPLREVDRAALASARAVAEYLDGEALKIVALQRKALADQRELASQAPDDVALAFNLARMLSELADPADPARRAEATRAWQRVLALDPPRPLADEARRVLGLSDAREAGRATSSAEDDDSDAGAPRDAAAACLGAAGAPLPLQLGLVAGKKNPMLLKPIGPPLDFGLGKLHVYAGPPATTSGAAGPPPWRAYAIETEFLPAAVQLVVQALSPPLALNRVREHLGAPEADAALADGRHVLRYKGCAWVVDGEHAVQRLSFQAE